MVRVFGVLQWCDCPGIHLWGAHTGPSIGDGSDPHCMTGLKLKPNKCAFFQKQVNYLGHVISHEGIATDPEKARQVANWPVPATSWEVQWIGLLLQKIYPDFFLYCQPTTQANRAVNSIPLDEGQPGSIWATLATFDNHTCLETSRLLQAIILSLTLMLVRRGSVTLFKISENKAVALCQPTLE